MWFESKHEKYLNNLILFKIFSFKMLKFYNTVLCKELIWYESNFDKKKQDNG